MPLFLGIFSKYNFTEQDFYFPTSIKLVESKYYATINLL